MKRVLGILFVVLLVFTVLAYLLFSSLDVLIARAIERVGSEATGAEVSLLRAELSARSGKGGLYRLKVGNPPGFETDYAMRFDEVRMKVDRDSLDTDTVVLKEVVVESPEVIYEITPSGSNLATILQNVQKYRRKKGAGAAEPEKPQDTGEGESAEKKKEPARKKEGARFLIDQLIIRNGTLLLRGTALQGQKLSATFPSMRLKGIGRGTGGATGAQVMEEVLVALVGASFSATGTLNVPALDKLPDPIESKRDKTRETMEQVGRKAKEALDETMKEVGKALQGGTAEESKK